LLELMTLEEVAEYLRVTKKTVYRLLERRRIPATKVGHQYRFDKTMIDDWLKQNTTGRQANILVVDDEETIGALFKETLEELGHTVTITNDSLRGFELAKERSYNLVFLDLKMPGFDGAEFFKQIREIKPDLPVTIITGYPDSDLMMKALSIGPFGVIKKPFTSQEIITVINTYLNAK